MNDLLKALIDLMEVKKVWKKYSSGISSAELYNELKNHGYEFTYISTLDIATEMHNYYGPGINA